MEYFGPRNITKALNLCESIQETHLLGCTQGVFMEHNFPGMTAPSEKTLPARRLSTANPYEPCDTIAPLFQQSCYYEITQLWDRVFQQNYKKMGELCAGISGDKKQEVCYLGVGRSAAEMSSSNTAIVLKRCALMPDRESQLLCHAGAYWLFGVTRQYKDMQQFCSAPGIDYRRCLNKVELIR
jgi:hypothetical protein